MERHMDRIAQAVGISPVEIRRRNFLQPGQTTTTEQTIRENIDLDRLLNGRWSCLTMPQRKRVLLKKTKVECAEKELGSQLFCMARIHGSGERYLNSLVGVEADAEGHVRVLVSSAEFGQGTNTVLCQIAAEALGFLMRASPSRSRTRRWCRTAARPWHRARR